MIYTSIKEALEAAQQVGAEVTVKEYADGHGPYVSATAIDTNGVWWLSFHNVNGTMLCTWKLVKVAEGRRVIFAKF